MHTTLEPEPGGDDSGSTWLGDPFWQQLRAGQTRAATRSAQPDLDAAWRRYCDVIRELEMTAAELESLRNSRS